MTSKAIIKKDLKLLHKALGHAMQAKSKLIDIHPFFGLDEFIEQQQRMNRIIALIESGIKELECILTSSTTTTKKPKKNTKRKLTQK